MACHGQAPWGATEPLDIRKEGREPQIAEKNGVRIKTSSAQAYTLLGSENKLNNLTTNQGITISAWSIRQM